MYYKNFEEVENRIEREMHHKYNKKHKHSRNTENYSRKGKNKFDIKDIDY